MSPRIEFDHEFSYRDLGKGLFPGLAVTLVGPAGEDDLIAIVDTAATYCLFNGIRAQAIGLDLASGRRETLSSLTGHLNGWIHRVELEILGSRFQCEVAFSDQPIPRELLGRHSLFEQIRIGFREGLSTGYFHPMP